ncbi:MAG TPA: HEAT repeat domain-containing protein [Rhodanobacteraceae bacterium]|nr:HEAT repeat domain-containing protein [Rhodanobacteraceae bacterium]
MYVTHRLTLRALLAAVLTIALAGASLAAHAASDDAMAPTDKQLNQLYWQGHEALQKGDWAGALKRFTDLEQQLRAKEPQSADAAIYWEAYTLLQAKRTTEAKTTIERLHRDFPKSRWGKDADALLRQTQPASTASKSANVSSDDEELAEIAVEGLMSAPPERAVPLLKKVLQSQHSDKVKKRALFVLSQIDEPAALDMVVDVARTSTDPALREEAVRMLGVSGDEHAIARLSDLYASSKDPREKRAIIQAWLVADRKDLILASARTETDETVRRQAIEALGAMDASTELKQLFDTTHDAANQRAIIQALGVAGNVKALTEIAESQQPDTIRIEAIHALGVAGDEGGGAALVKLYPKANTPALRDAVIQGLMVAGDSDAMMQLYRQSKTREEKQALLRVITTMGDDAALDLIESELNKPKSEK